MRVDLDHFEGQGVERVYFAFSVKEAERVEQILDASPFPYTIDVDPYYGGISSFFGSISAGVGFYVAPSSADACRKLLAENGLTTGNE